MAYHMSKRHRRMLRNLPHPRPTKARPIRLQANGISVAKDKASQCWMREFEALLATPKMQKRIMDNSINIALYGTPWPEDWVKAHSHLRQYFAPLTERP